MIVKDLVFHYIIDRSYAMKKLFVTTVLVIYFSTAVHAGECYGQIHTVVPYLISLKTLVPKTEISTRTRKSSPAEEKIQPLLYAIDDKTKQIKKNLETYFQNMEIVQDILTVKSNHKQAFSEEQMITFQSLSKKISMEYKRLQQILSSIYKEKDLKDVQQEILKIDTDFDKIQYSFEEIILYQNLALESLSILIEDSNNMIHIVL